MTRLERAKAELLAAAQAAGRDDIYATFRDLDCAAAEGLANQKLGTTISAWVARNRIAGKGWACVGCRLLTWLFRPFNGTEDHCNDALGKG